MARNIEIKAEIKCIDDFLTKAEQISNQGPVEIYQDDTFFKCDAGRLKLRKFSDVRGELIFYQRPDKTGPKQSFYVITPTTSPDLLIESLSLAYGTDGRVQKHRTLFIVGRTRIHLDRVENLGHFIELEVVLGERDAPEEGVKEANSLMQTLGIDPAKLIEDAYVDLAARKQVQAHASK